MLKKTTHSPAETLFNDVIEVAADDVQDGGSLVQQSVLDEDDDGFEDEGGEQVHVDVVSGAVQSPAVQNIIKTFTCNKYKLKTVCTLLCCLKVIFSFNLNVNAFLPTTKEFKTASTF